ncbi:MAG TPA: hypothetical protein VJ994_10585, partial [Paracoccaceae bacterium]|nr:hypothetical protein [Paracoccaceae bacterium]
MPDRLWRFLRDEKNRAVLGWIGGGAVVVAGGLWAAFGPGPAPETAPATEAGVVAPAADGVRIGVAGGVSGGTVSIDQSVTTVNEGASAEDLARI